MNLYQMDAFSKDESVDEVRLKEAIKIVESEGYHLIKTAEDAKKKAIEAGYHVTDPLMINNKIVTLKDLRDYFFMKLWTKYPENQKFYVSNFKTEFRLIRLFVESREKTGLNRFYAIQECISIIDIIFEHIKEFNFKSPIDIRVLGQAKSSWITEKALYILNNKRLEEEKKKMDRKIEEIERHKEINLEERSKQLEELLINMEDNNG